MTCCFTAHEGMLRELGQDLFYDTEICREVTPFLGCNLQYFLYSDSAYCVSARVLSHFSRLRLCVTPMDCSPPGSSVHGVFQARILEWIAMPFSRGSS